MLKPNWVHTAASVAITAKDRHIWTTAFRFVGHATQHRSSIQKLPSTKRRFFSAAVGLIYS